MFVADSGGIVYDKKIVRNYKDERYDKICVKPAVDTCSGVGVNFI